jgi:hypothetical protein
MQTFENEALNNNWKKNYMHLTNSGRKVYAEVLKNAFEADSKLIFDMTHHRLAEITGLHQKSVAYAFRDMLDLGILSKVKRPNGRNAMSTYEISLD